ncbi:hypothetical protein LCGC14_1634850, partial [marine sediment metagenome]
LSASGSDDARIIGHAPDPRRRQQQRLAHLLREDDRRRDPQTLGIGDVEGIDARVRAQDKQSPQPAGEFQVEMLLVADGGDFPFREGVELAERQKTAAGIQRENYKAIKKLNEKQTDITEQWLRDKNERQEREMDMMKEKILRLERRPVAK